MSSNNQPAKHLLANTKTPLWRELIYRSWSALRRTTGTLKKSSKPGMGALPHFAGTSFRVWAPHAKRITVTGDFNGWSRERHALASEHNGYWSADIIGASTGDAYKYLIHGSLSRLVRADPYVREIDKGYGNGIIRPIEDVEQESPPPWLSSWNELVIYEMHIGTFNGAVDEQPGTFAAAIEKLPYLAKLGINAIEIMPVAEFAGDYSWGYNPAHPYAVTQAYGGPDEFRRLVEAIHERGIAVILDVVYNHFGPQDLDLWQFDGWQQDGKGGIYFYNDWRSKTPWADTRPDYGRPEVRQYIRDNALMWFDEYNVDGLRWDATSYIRNVHGHDGDPGSDVPEGWDLMRWVNDEIDARRPWSLNIAEDMQVNSQVTAPTIDGGAGFDSQWDANFVHSVRAAIIAAEDEQRDMEAVAEAILFRHEGDAFHRVIYTESHDEVANGKARVPEDIAPGNAGTLFARLRSVLGAALVFTTPGIPMIFQGQEFLEDGWFDDHDPLDWSKKWDNSGIKTLYSDLIHLRRNCDNMSRGLTGQHVKVTHLDNENKLIAYHRWEFGGPGDDVVVVANFANEAHKKYTLSFPHDGKWKLRINTGDRQYDKEFPKSKSGHVKVEENKATIAIGPYSVLIYSQDP